MVSTRQMCGNAGGAGFDETPTSTRATVVRRTTHYQPHNQQQVATCTSAAGAAAPVLQFLDLPTELIIKTLGYLDYKKISNLRLVSSRMNDICMNMLNVDFARQIKTTFNRFQSIKSSMPRRESARRQHPLACECDIIETCYMRLSLLQMSMGKHIERGHCCFFPGAILDEVHSILNYISITPRLQRPYRVTDELFDLSTMAMEYFKDRIEPTLPGLAYFNKDFFQLPATTKRPTLAISSDLSDSSNNSPPQNHMVLRKGIRKIKQGMKMYNNQLSVLRTELRTCKRKAAEQSKQLAEQQNLLAEHQKQTLEYANRLDENDKKNEEMARKFSTLLQELNKCKTELQFWRSKSPAISSVCSSCNQKVAPVLQPEDLQALVNQGVDPGHIIIINDETDPEADADGAVEGNVSGCELAVSVDKSFAFPDESTTAKLLAVNTAAKNQKRKYAATVDTEIAATSNAIASNATPSYSKAVAQQTTSASCGYSTKLFYGNHQRSGVIVSPVSMKLATVPDNSNGMPPASVQQLLQQPDNGDASLLAVGATESASNLVLVEQVEAKKARRVQKANRCLNAHGKRSK
ncbi:F-box only protein 28 [Drosophila virilis]|uniref:F-box domain-containing protein n=1 Tax=Drosophila virilis TaxID=7244 RepID=B4LJD3_DROVI|nr:F-box only protein 28 [Drosophila virilis]EDW60513.1 uncharacterized protein Dvir_GJ20816 [Drosophila virilis]